MLGKTRLLAAAALSLAVAGATAVMFAASGAAAPGVTILAKDGGVSMKPNRYVQDTMFFAPGTVTVKSGASLTFTYAAGMSMDPHTLTIVKQSDLPKSGAAVMNCKVCNAIAGAHLKNPKGQPGPANPIVHWTVDAGAPGLDEPGDSIAIQPGAHKSITVKVTAPAGTTLHYLCAVHPWMQGTIVVK